MKPMFGVAVVSLLTVSSSYAQDVDVDLERDEEISLRDEDDGDGAFAVVQRRERGDRPRDHAEMAHQAVRATEGDPAGADAWWSGMGAVAVIALVGLAACLIPARRVARMSPMAALRQD